MSCDKLHQVQLGHTRCNYCGYRIWMVITAFGWETTLDQTMMSKCHCRYQGLGVLQYPVVAVRTPLLVPSYHTVVLTTSQVAIIQVDAADDKATSDICHKALREEGTTRQTVSSQT